MLLQFSKMHGLGNDFMVVDTISQPVFFNQSQIQRLADRNFGVGFDQLLLIEPPQHPEIDFHFRIFNADGTEVSHCGNGARCVARFVRQKGLIWRYKMRLSTISGPLDAKLERNGMVSVDMGVPSFEPEKIPLRFAARAESYHLDVAGVSHEVSAVSMGNPHCVLTVADVDRAPVAELGASLSRHSYFPDEANVGFMQIIDKSNVKLRVFERGVGETLACGTGACAAAVTGQTRGLLDEQVKVVLPGGEIVIRWRGEQERVAMTGPAQHVYDGQIEL